MTKDEKVQDFEFYKTPLLSFEDAVAASGEGSYLLPCYILGRIPLKHIKVASASSRQVMVSGSTVGIYMETRGYGIFIENMLEH